MLFGSVCRAARAEKVRETTLISYSRHKLKLRTFAVVVVVDFSPFFPPQIKNERKKEKERKKQKRHPNVENVSAIQVKESWNMGSYWLPENEKCTKERLDKQTHTHTHISHVKNKIK